MSINYRQLPGLGAVGSYQVSGKPWVTGNITNIPDDGGDALKIEFPTVTKWIMVVAHDLGSQPTNVKVAFSQNGYATKNYFTVHGHKNAGYAGGDIPQRLELKVCELYLSGTCTDVDVIAGLTGISCNELQDNWSGSAGVG